MPTKRKTDAKLTHNQWELAILRCRFGEPVVEVAKDIGVNYDTLYKRVERHEAISIDAMLDGLANRMRSSFTSEEFVSKDMSSLVSAVKMFAERDTVSATERIEEKIDMLIERGQESQKKHG